MRTPPAITPQKHQVVKLGDILEGIEKFAGSSDPRVIIEVSSFRRLYHQIAIPDGTKRADFAIDDDLVPILASSIKRIERWQEEWQAGKGHLN